MCGVVVQDSLTQVLSADDPRHGPAPPARRVRKAVYPTEASCGRQQPAAAAAQLSPITHERLTRHGGGGGVEAAAADTSWTPTAISSCRRRNLYTWDTVNTITGETLPYSVSEHSLQVRDAWVSGQIQDAVAPPPDSDRNTVVIVNPFVPA